MKSARECAGPRRSGVTPGQTLQKSSKYPVNSTDAGRRHSRRVSYYLERRDPEIEPKMAEVLCVYREVEMRRVVSGGAAQEPAIAVISYDMRRPAWH